jgi:guanosine-3',5'-bis(diphosphate) 3'-pyrophosphohydrolase
VAPPADDLALVLRALHFAADKHRHQRRKDVHASPYINHPIAVAEALRNIGGVRDAATLAAGILHDTIEDTETTPAELEAVFGREIRAIVEEVTDDKSLPPAMRKQRQIDHAPQASLKARLVKLADKLCNIRDLVDAPPAGWPPERRRHYVAWAQAVVAGVRGTNTALEGDFDRMCARVLTQLGPAETDAAG